MNINAGFLPQTDEGIDPWFVAAKCDNGFLIIDAANGVPISHTDTKEIAGYVADALNFYEDCLHE